MLIKSTLTLTSAPIWTSLNFSEDLRMFSKHFPPVFNLVRFCTWVSDQFLDQNYHKGMLISLQLNGLKVFPKRDNHQCFSNLSYSQRIWMKWGNSCLWTVLQGLFPMTDPVCPSQPQMISLSPEPPDDEVQKVLAIGGKPISPTPCYSAILQPTGWRWEMSRHFPNIWHLPSYPI